MAVLAVINFEIYGPIFWKWAERISVRNCPLMKTVYVAVNKQIH